MSSKQRELYQNIIKMIHDIDEPNAPSHLLGLISKAVPIDSFILFCYRKQAIPDVLFEQLNYPERDNTLAKYLDGAYLLDPFYQLSLNHKAVGLYHLKEIAPDHFRQSEYYHKYYKNSGLVDELNYFFPLDENNLMVIALGRTKKKGRFSKKDKVILHDLIPIVEYFCATYWAKIDRKKHETNEQFARGMTNFGKSILTEKEREVMHFLLKGHSAKSTAQKMKIAPGTVKLHRSNIYTKLDIGSQTELFSLFIDALSHIKHNNDEDPLIKYHRHTA
ncbi:MAG: helix-turn-helix transcriptional regulator [Emcibacter sp.]|nr:helix-turn-helix transcriptional regulator [Emcibacter sp.]